jgi:hypothetical protein
MTLRNLSRRRLFHARAAALNQDHQNDDRQNPGNNPDNHRCCHANIPFLLNVSSVF